MRVPLVLTVFFALIVSNNAEKRLKIIREWKKLDFQFPSEEIRNESLSSGKWIPEYPFTIDVDVEYSESLDGKSRVFVTVPRFSGGIPITLGYLGKNPNDLQIIPYPDYSWQENQGTNCDRFTSVIRVAIDECGQLWVLDIGKIGEEEKCPPQIFVFNLQNNQLVRNYKFPSSQYVAESLFIVPIVDVKCSANNCRDTKVYISDVNGLALIVYDYDTNQSWRIENSLFHPEEAFRQITLAGITFDLPDGIFGLSVSPKNQAQRKLYFHALASDKENSVPLSLIDDQATWINNPNAAAASFVTIGNRGTQTPSQAMDQYGNLFFVLIEPIALACWDSSTPYNRDNIKIIYQNDDTLQFASGLKIVKNLNGVEEIWISTNRLQKLWIGVQDFNEINFIIQKQKISGFLKGTECSGTPLSSF